MNPNPFMICSLSENDANCIIQDQLNICQKEICYFIVFTSVDHPLYVKQVYRDHDFWKEKMMPKLYSFYMECILPEIVRGNRLKNLKCIDPKYIVEARNKKMNEKKNYYKELLTMSEIKESQDFQSRKQYMEKLEAWVNQARFFRDFNEYFPLYLLQSSLSINSVNERNINESVQTADTNDAFQFLVPPIWKRILAEAVDFFILFAVKLALTLFFIEVIDTSTWQYLKLDFVTPLTEINVGTELTTSIIILETIHRFVVCLYEIYWLRGSNDIPFSSATPGKSLVGITVVNATKIRQSEIRNNRQTILVFPGKDLGWMTACSRSFVKNFVLAIMFPFCFAFFLFQHNRTGYDVICNTVVVEYDSNPPKRPFGPL